MVGGSKETRPVSPLKGVTPGVRVEVAREGEQDPVAAALAVYLADESEAVRLYLGLESLPAVFVTHRQDLDCGRYELGSLERSEGLHVRLNFRGQDCRKEHFLAWPSSEILVLKSEQRGPPRAETVVAPARIRPLLGESRPPSRSNSY